VQTCHRQDKIKKQKEKNREKLEKEMATKEEMVQEEQKDMVQEEQNVEGTVPEEDSLDQKMVPMVLVPDTSDAVTDFQKVMQQVAEATEIQVGIIKGYDAPVAITQNDNTEGT
jgi:hypothetical protein